MSLFPEQFIFRWHRPLLSVWSQPHKFGTDSLHFLCTFISQAAMRTFYQWKTWTDSSFKQNRDRHRFHVPKLVLQCKLYARQRIHFVGKTDQFMKAFFCHERKNFNTLRSIKKHSRNFLSKQSTHSAAAVVSKISPKMYFISFFGANICTFFLHKCILTQLQQLQKLTLSN